MMKVPDDEELSPEAFDEVYAQISAAAQANKLFDQVLGPFPPGVEPFSLVPRRGLDRVLAELRLGRGDHLVDLCCGRGGIGLWFASVSGARLTGVDFSPGAIAGARRRAELFVPARRHRLLLLMPRTPPCRPARPTHWCASTRCSWSPTPVGCCARQPGSCARAAGR
jgi:hypothetical protein